MSANIWYQPEGITKGKISAKDAQNLKLVYDQDMLDDIDLIVPKGYTIISNGKLETTDYVWNQKDWLWEHPTKTSFSTIGSEIEGTNWIVARKLQVVSDGDRFFELTERFQDLSDHFLATKSSSFTVDLRISNKSYEVEGKYGLTLGTYDIGDMPRHMEVGNFKSMVDICDAFEAIIIKAEEILAQEEADGTANW
jgi:hypothetical protein